MLKLAMTLLAVGAMSVHLTTMPAMPTPEPAPPTTVPTAAPERILIDPHEGLALYYENPDLMRQVGQAACNNRGDPEWGFARKIACNPETGAVLSPGVSTPHWKIGAWLQVCGIASGVCITRQQVDVSHPDHIQGHINSGIVAELSFWDSVAVCGDGVGRPANCKVRVRQWSAP